jgi:DNA-directed RNA polymerase specialized sigma24 family protein
VFAASDLPAGPDDQVADLFGNLTAAEPTPDEAAAAAEEFHRLIDLLGDEELRQVARARLEGYTNEEIADRMRLSLATVERKLMRVRKRWQEELAG